MLEYFFVERMCAKHDEENPQENFYGGAVIGDSMGLVALAISVVAAYLAYQKNAHESPGMRVIVTLLAFLFSQIYLIYYVVRYVLMKDGERKSGRRSGKGKGKGNGKGKGKGQRRK